MREIRFRGKTGTGKWIYGGGIAFSQHGNPHIEVLSKMWSRVIYDTVGQYTGMKDLNGNEIYEGDIVKTNYDDVGVVAMGEHNGINGSEAFNIGFYIIWDNLDDRSWMRNELLYFIKKIGVTVIGNRWDNPELLGGADSD